MEVVSSLGNKINPSSEIDSEVGVSVGGEIDSHLEVEGHLAGQVSAHLNPNRKNCISRCAS